MKQKIVILLLLAVVAGAAFWKWRPHSARKSDGLVLYGNVDIREVNLGFRVSGRIKEMLKDEGDAVKLNEPLARLDADLYQRELEQASAQAASLRAKVGMLENGYRREEIAQARAALVEREATLENAERLAARRKDLVLTKAIAQEDYDDAASRVKEAKARVNAASSTLALQEAGFRKEEVAQAKADLAQAEAAEATARIHLQDTELKSPADGIIITRAQEPGAIVQAGAIALTVSLEKPVWVRAFVDEPHLGALHPGAVVEIHTDSRRGKPYRGQVGYISPRAEFTPKSVETAELRTSLVYRLRIVVTDADASLRQGMPVTVKLATQ